MRMRFLLWKQPRLVAYFWSYCFFSRERQRLLLLMALSLGLASFALLVLQGIMTGLQWKMIRTHKMYQGSAYISLPSPMASDLSRIQQLQRELLKKNIPSQRACQLELLLKKDQFIAPALALGIDDRDPFAKSPLLPFLNQRLGKQLATSALMGSELAYRLKVSLDSTVELYAPTASVGLVSEVPRFALRRVSSFLTSHLPEVDDYYLWTRMSLLQNLLGQEVVNRLLLPSLSSGQLKQVQALLKENYSAAQLRRWEDDHQDLLWAFNLEEKVMVFLFTMMVILVSMTIMSAFSVFLSRMRVEFFTFSFLGVDYLSLKKALFQFAHQLTLVSLLIGAFLGTAMLLFLKYSNWQIMPDIFLERSFPIEIRWIHFVYALLLPYLLANSFSAWSIYLNLYQRRGVEDYLKYLK